MGYQDEIIKKAELRKQAVRTNSEIEDAEVEQVKREQQNPSLIGKKPRPTLHDVEENLGGHKAPYNNLDATRDFLKGNVSE